MRPNRPHDASKLMPRGATAMTSQPCSNIAAELGLFWLVEAPVTVVVTSTRSSWPVRAFSSTVLATTVRVPGPSGLLVNVDVISRLPSAVKSAAGMAPVATGRGVATMGPDSRSPPAPLTSSSRYAVRSGRAGRLLLLCHSNAMREFPAQDTWNGAPLALVVHVRTAPVAIVITRTPVYWHRRPPAVLFGHREPGAVG